MSGTRGPQFWPEPDPRILRLDYLWLSRNYSGPLTEWELNKGFRLSVLGPGWFALFLGARALPPEADPLGYDPGFGEEPFLLGLPPAGADESWLKAGRELLGGLGWTRGTVAILGDYRDRKGQLASVYRASKAVFAKSLDSGAVFWVWQPMPQARRREGLAFFSVEQQLYQWGRVGRRLARRCKWRRLWPW